MDTGVQKKVVDFQMRYWWRLFAVALASGLWLLPVLLLALPANLPFREAIISTSVLSGVVAACMAFFVGMSAGVRLPK